MDSLLSLDRTITEFFYYQTASPALQKGLYIVASSFVYAIPILLVALFFRSHRDRIVATKLFLASVLAWQGLASLTGSLLYNTYGFRDRPFAEAGLPELLFEQPQKAFPSDHASVLMAVTIGLFVYRYPKLGYLFLVGGIISSLARVMLGFHWFGDIIGGWILGALAVGILWLFDRPLSKLIEWVIQKLSRSYGRR